MSEKTKARRAALGQALVDAAERGVVAGGLASVKARDLAAEAGCSLGAIYNVYPDLPTLFMEVNARTFAELDAALSASQDGQATPREALVAMALAYLDYAEAHTNRWRALFDLELPEDPALSDWYLTRLRGLFSHIGRALAQLWPDRDRAEIEMMTRTLFSSVHGIVLLGLERRFSNIPPEEVGRMIRGLLAEI